MTDTPSTEPTQPIRILIVDDQALVRLGFRMVLEAEADLNVVGEAGDGETAIRLAVETSPDVILMDVRMPGLDGIEATRRIVAADPAARIIILTTFDLDEYAFGGLRAGASGFLLKDVRPAELTQAIRSVAAGDAAVSSRVTKAMLDLFSDRLPAAGAARADVDPIAALTPREREILQAIAEGLSNGEIAGKFYLTESTVKTHVGRVLAKLELRDRVHAVIFAYENGLLAR
ncbi:response regulator transcription factor [Diaminobutyricibacter sp. McL0608]|uniref:response regulator transcription factor n=1 Tax=Leifsonia sp. McL0608 TaxID=3143537 RepID=UPI0031F2E8C5